MARIRTIAPGRATGRLAQAYRRAGAARGHVANILQVQSLDPEALDAHLQLYRRVMLAPGPLSRFQRELVAVVVSKVNACDY